MDNTLCANENAHTEDTCAAPETPVIIVNACATSGNKADKVTDAMFNTACGGLETPELRQGLIAALGHRFKGVCVQAFMNIVAGLELKDGKKKEQRSSVCAEDSGENCSSLKAKHRQCARRRSASEEREEKRRQEATAAAAQQAPKLRAPAPAFVPPWASLYPDAKRQEEEQAA